MTIISMIAADFNNRQGDRFQITRNDIGIIKEAPDWIKDTLMFKWAAADGAIKFVNSANKKELENDPMKGIAADGKAKKQEVKVDEAKEPVVVEAVVVPVEEAPAEEKPKKATRSKKADASGDAE